MIRRFNICKSTILSALLITLFIYACGQGTIGLSPDDNNSSQNTNQFVVTLSSLPDKFETGDVYFPKVNIAPEPESIVVLLDDKELTFFKTDAGEYSLLLPFDFNVTEEVHKIKIEIQSKDGSSESYSRDIQVAIKDRGLESLTVDPSFIDYPPDIQTRVDEEQAVIDALGTSTPKEKYWEDSFVYPVDTPIVVTSPFGIKRTYNGTYHNVHKGVDLRATSGTELHAANSGVVVLVDDFYLYGNIIGIDHGLGVISFYAHLSKVDVNEGDSVERGQLIGLSGATGRVTAAHLHWEVHVNGSLVSPLDIINL
jgi:murein DD-endopeptidase MepM/ murein hydrolase activator NlpD